MDKLKKVVRGKNDKEEDEPGILEVIITAVVVNVVLPCWLQKLTN